MSKEHVSNTGKGKIFGNIGENENNFNLVAYLETDCPRQHNLLENALTDATTGQSPVPSSTGISPCLAEVIRQCPDILSNETENYEKLTETQLYQKLRSVYEDLFKRANDIKPPRYENDEFRKVLREKLITGIESAELLKSMVLASNRNDDTESTISQLGTKSASTATCKPVAAKSPTGYQWKTIHKPRFMKFRVFTPSQTEYLQAVFKTQQNPSQKTMAEIGTILQIDYQRVRRWFCNRRRPYKNRKLGN